MRKKIEILGEAKKTNNIEPDTILFFEILLDMRNVMYEQHKNIEIIKDHVKELRLY